MDNFEIIGWPDIQEYMNEEDFDENATLINPNDWMGINSCTYLVKKDWLESFNEQ